ncbi:hypothetical protein KXS07_03785 [Inquilinus limosus]|uniref:HMA2 domain-containing protein n=1 Tax=Inquilinus limosus TaxID=171674 RepID=UPI00040385FE|nr:hypothetical protein [Inquilinus limosus]
MADRPAGHICHLTPGRIRIRIPERRHDAAYFAAVQDRLSQWAGVEAVAVNPRTASVLVHYSDAAGLFHAHATANDLFTLVDPPVGRPASPAAWIRSAAGRPRGRLGRGWSAAKTELRSAIAIGLLGAGVYQLLRGRIAAPAVTLLWYAGDAAGLWRNGLVPRPPPSTTDTQEKRA